MYLGNRYTRRAILRHLEVKLVPVAELKQLGRETRQHPPKPTGVRSCRHYRSTAKYLLQKCW